VVGERLSVLGWAGLSVIGAALVVLAFAPANVEAEGRAALVPPAVRA